MDTHYIGTTYKLYMSENKVSDSQKQAQKRYDKKVKMISIKYTLSEMEEYTQLKEYLEKTNQSMNGFVKGLIRYYFALGQGTIYERPLEKKLHKKVTYDRYKNITLEDVQPLIDYFGKTQIQALLSQYERIFDDVVLAEREAYETKLLIWMEDVMKRVEQGEFEDMEQNEKYHKLKDELIELLK